MGLRAKEFCSRKHLLGLLRDAFKGIPWRAFVYVTHQLRKRRKGDAVFWPLTYLYLSSLYWSLAWDYHVSWQRCCAYFRMVRRVHIPLHETPDPTRLPQMEPASRMGRGQFSRPQRWRPYFGTPPSRYVYVANLGLTTNSKLADFSPQGLSSQSRQTWPKLGFLRNNCIIGCSDYA